MSAAGLMRRLPLVGLAAVVAALALVPATGAPAPGRAAPASIQLVRFGGGSHLGGRGIFSSRPALGRGGRFRTPSRSRGILRRIGHALAFAAILHFLFAGSSGFGFVILLLLIAALVMMRRRRRRTSYQTRW